MNRRQFNLAILAALGGLSGDPYTNPVVPIPVNISSTPQRDLEFLLRRAIVVIDNRDLQAEYRQLQDEIFAITGGIGSCRKTTKIEQQECTTSLDYIGTGVIIDPERGFIITAAHNLERYGTPVSVRLLDDREQIPVTVIAYNPELDLAVLQAPDLKHYSPAFLPLADDDPPIGTSVYSLGLARAGTNIDHNVKTHQTIVGSILAAHNLEPKQFSSRGEMMFYSQLATRKGDSGGAIVNSNGELVGIVTNEGGYAACQHAIIQVIGEAEENYFLGNTIEIIPYSE